MSDYALPLGETVRKARMELGLTQNEVANAIGIDGRTVLNIENQKGNPKLEVLYPLIRYLQIAPEEIFYPEIQRQTPALQKLRLLVEHCEETEAAALIPVLEAVLGALRCRNSEEKE